MCIRLLRRKALQVFESSPLRTLDWQFVTVFVDGWTVPAGSHAAFSCLREHPYIRAFIGRLRRQEGDVLRVFGSIETVYKTVDNRPVGKPFHLHLLVSGRVREQIDWAAKQSFPLATSVAVPLRIEEVGTGPDDVLNVAGYAFKQPYWKRSYPSLDVHHSRKQLPKLPELAELVGNLGAHPWNGRLVLTGIRLEQGRFCLVENKSTSTAGKRRRP